MITGSSSPPRGVTICSVQLMATRPIRKNTTYLNFFIFFKILIVEKLAGAEGQGMRIPSDLAGRIFSS